MNIAISQNKICVIDDCDLELISRYKWHYYARIGGTCGYAFANIYSKETQKQQRIAMHRLIMQCPAGLFVDHIDGNGLNNTRANLRICSRAQNNANRRSARSSMSMYLGVCLFKGRWRAQIRQNGKKTHIGLYDTEIEAALAYNRMAQICHGEFARLNIITTQEQLQ